MYATNEIYVWFSLIILLTIVVLEIWKPAFLNTIWYNVNEGFEGMVSVGESQLWAKYMPRRGDIGLNPTEEQSGYTRDSRYFSGYTDVQRIGQKHDFCRMVHPANSDEKEMFFACGLGGTEGLSTVKYKTPSVAEGLEISRDDYMGNLGNGQTGYCRILKTAPDQFELKCNPAGVSSFDKKLVGDATPPEDIKTLLSFYEGVIFWLRLRDDMLDYAKNLTVSVAGTMEIDERPNPLTTDGLEFNGEDQYLRIGDATDLTFGSKLNLQYMRAISFWVYFEEFTNNAHILDFGNGAGIDNVFIGILGRGNAGTQQATPDSMEYLKTIPEYPSGQQCVVEQSPQVALHTSRADVEQWDCPKPELFGRMMEPLHKREEPAGQAKVADMIYEIWDKKQRKVHIQVKNVFTVRKWTHIVLTYMTNEPFRSGLKVYKNGEETHTEQSVWLPQESHTTKNYIGKSNWSDSASQQQNGDELFKGKMCDIRGYQTMITKKKATDIYKWGKRMLGVGADAINTEL
jgi:hypothetical protein